ncbi:transposase [bacterium]|nr:transposase [bacterium]
MARVPRVDLEGYWYHVIARGNNRQRIFTCSEERARYLKLLDETCGLTRAVFSAYSLVPNHLHLLIRRGTQPLSVLMQRLQGDYARYFNHRHRRTGHVFERRYKAFLVTDDSYVNCLVVYIHGNLPKAGLGKENEDRLWSSHRFYLGRTQGAWRNWRPAPGFEGRNGIRAYRELSGEMLGAELPPLTVERPYAYGEEGAWEGINRRREGRGLSKRAERRTIRPIESIVEDVSRRRRVGVDLMRSRNRRRSITRIRHEAVLECLAEGHGPTAISRYFSIDPTSIFTVIRRHGDPRKVEINQ